MSDTDAPAEAGPLAPTAQAVLAYVVKAVVGDPAAVAVHASERTTAVRLDVEVGQGDLGRVIGKRGRTAHAIRTVTRAAAARDGVDVEVEFLD